MYVAFDSPVTLLSLSSDHRSMFGLFFLSTKKAHLFVIDRVRTNQMPNMANLYHQSRTHRVTTYDYPVPEDEFSFDVRVDTEARRVSG